MATFFFFFEHVTWEGQGEWERKNPKQPPHPAQSPM